MKQFIRQVQDKKGISNVFVGIIVAVVATLAGGFVYISQERGQQKQRMQQEAVGEAKVEEHETTEHQEKKTVEPAPTVVSAPIRNNVTASMPEICSTTVPLSGDSATLDDTVAPLVLQIEDLADPFISMSAKARVSTIAKRARHAVVHISTGGTGSLVSPDGYIITNAHLVAGAPEVTVVTYDGRKYTGKVVARVAELDPDLALVKINGDNFPFLPLAEKATVDTVVVYVGHPNAADWVGVGGTIEGIENREIIKGVVWTEVTYTNPIANGSSGSALLNCDGEIVAIVYGGGDTIAQHEKVSEKFQNAVLWNSDDYKIVYEQRAVGVDSLRTFLSKHAEGLLEANQASRELAVTRLATFVAPSFPDDLCRICVIEDVSHFVEFIKGNTPQKQVAFLRELLQPEKSRAISAEDRKKILAVGRQIQGAVVKIMGEGGHHKGTGSFISPDGYIITNAHVIEGAAKTNVELFDGRKYVARLIGTTYPDNQPDLALLKIDTDGLPWIKLANELNIGDIIVGVGHPNVLEWVIWGGKITYIDEDPAPGKYQEPVSRVVLDDAVNVSAGSSGSAIVNLDGRIVKIHNSESTDFNIPTEKLKMRGEWLRDIVIWDQKTLSAFAFMTPSGIHVDLVRGFVNKWAPGLLD